jgi:hypothetical protein
MCRARKRLIVNPDMNARRMAIAAVYYPRVESARRRRTVIVIVGAGLEMEEVVMIAGRLVSLAAVATGARGTHAAGGTGGTSIGLFGDVKRAVICIRLFELLEGV